MRSVIGSGVALDHTSNFGTLIDIHRAANPTTMLGMVDHIKDADKCRQLQQALPGAQVIARVWHEHEGGYAQPPSGAGDTRSMIATPEGILGQQGHLGQDGLWLHVMNEPSLFMKPFEVQRTIDWLIAFVQAAAPRGVDSVIGNFADGHPAVVGGLWDPVTWPLLRVMAEHPERVRLGLHFYGPDGVADVLTALNETCKTLGILAPQVVGTEFGLDSTGQGDSKNGYHTRMDGAAFMVWQRDTVQGALRPFFESGQLIGVDTFQWNPLWGAFNIGKDPVYQQTYQAMGSKGELDVTVISSGGGYKAGVRPANLKGGYGYKVLLPAATQKRNLRALPTDTSADVGDVPTGATIRLYDIPVERNALKNQKWQYCILLDGDRETGEGWMWTDGIKLTPVEKPAAPVEAEPAPVTPVTPVTPPTPAPAAPVVGQTRYWMSRAERQALIETFQQALLVLTSLQESEIAES